MAEFEQALERWEFTRAELLLKAISDPQARLLAECELQLAYQRPDRTFVLTDTLDPAAIAPTLQAKFHYIKVRQTVSLRNKTIGELSELVHRLVREGLRRDPRPYDRRCLLMYRLGWSDKSQAGFGREAIEEMGEMGSEWGLEAEAKVARRRGDPKRAASLTKTLLELAELKGHERLAVRHALSLRRYLADLGRREEADSLLKSLTQRAIDSGEPEVILRVALRNLATSSETEGDQGRAVFQRFLGLLPDYHRKARLMERYSRLQSKSKKIETLASAEELARSAGDVNLQAAMIYGQALSSSGGVFRLLQKRMRDLVEGRDVRGAGHGWFSFPLPKKAGKKSLSGDPVLEFRQSMSEATSKRQRAELRRRGYSKAFASTKLNPALGREVLASFVADLPRLADLDILSELAYPADSLSPLSGGARITGRGEHSFEPRSLHLGLTLGHTFQGKHPVALRHALSAHVRQITEKQKPRTKAERIVKLASLLALLGRFEEAVELDRAAIRLEPKLSELRARIEHLILAGEYGEAAELQARLLTSSSHPSSDWGQKACIDLLSENQNAALESCQRALNTNPNSESVSSLVYMGVPLIMVEAMIGRSDFKEAEDLVLSFSDSDSSSSLLVLRAQVLTAAGRPEIARRILDRAGDGYSTSSRLYRIARRRDVAEALEDKVELAKLDARIKELVGQLRGEVKDPVLQHFLLSEPAFSALPVKVAIPVLSKPEPSTDSFAEILEQLEELRRREPENEELRRLSGKDLKALMTEAKPGELFVQPILLQHSVVAICVAKGQGLVQETFCDTVRLRQTMLRVSAAAAQLRQSKNLQKEEEYITRWLIQPWRDHFPSQTKIRWMGEGELHDFPVSMLRDGNGPLVSQLSFLYLDGPKSRVVTVRKGQSVLLVGGAEDLPGTKAELKSVRELFPRGESWRLGQELDKLKDLAQRHQLIHISTHGTAPSDNRLAGELKGTRGSLTAFHLSELKFPPKTLAVIGACDSGLGHGEGHDNTSLISALRTAGAEMVLGSTWTLDDQSVGNLFLEFYREILAGTEAPLALVRAQSVMRKTHPHPYYWAGVRLVTGP